MGHRALGFTVLALGAVSTPCAAWAQGLPAGSAVAALAPVAGPLPAFDLGATVRVGTVRELDTERRSAALKEDGRRQTKVKIRWRYQPVEGGPRFEVGTFGSRKGVMKSKLLHVAVDWSF